MEISVEPLRITKELILSRVSEEALMSHYLGVPITKGLFRSPLRSDKHATCGFYRSNKGELRFKDFRGDHNMNAFDVVMHRFNCSFYSALQIIANDFGIISRKDLKKNKAKIQYQGEKFEETKQAIIQVEIRPFQDYESGSIC